MLILARSQDGSCDHEAMPGTWERCGMQQLQTAGTLEQHDSVANCWWHPISVNTQRAWQEHPLMVSIAILSEWPFTAIADRYDRLERTHEEKIGSSSRANGIIINKHHEGL